ncbi:MAG: hypothetical protein AABX88_00370, partial [Nanoarchaeota archaeon]
EYCKIITSNENGVADHDYFDSSTPDKSTKYPSNLLVDGGTLNSVRTISLDHSKQIELNKNINKLETIIYLK